MNVRAESSTSRAAEWATVVVLVLFLCLCVRGAVDSGLSWDENDHRAYGQWVLGWYRSLDMAAPAQERMSQYGALFGVVCASFERVFPAISYITLRHVASALVAFVGLIFAVRSAREIGGPRAGFLTALLLATTPRWTGDALFNPIDIPFAAFTAVALYYLVRLVHALPAPPRSAWVKLGLATGAALGVRIGGILVFFYLGVVLALWTILSFQRPTSGARPDQRETWRRARGLALGWITTLLVAYAVACAFWPYLLVNPLLSTLALVRSSSSFAWTGSVLFGGELYDGSALPRSYLPVWFLITLPPLFFVALATIVVRRRIAATHERARRLALLALMLAIVFPPTYAALVHATLYDGLRHFMFVIPPLAVVCGVALASAYEALRVRSARIAAALVVAACAAEPVWWFLRSHPYEYTYFNPLVGGLRRASHEYETDYWGLSLRAAAEWVEANRALFARNQGEIVVATNTSWHLLAPWFRADQHVRESRGPDDPAHVIIEHYRHRPPGWERTGRPLMSFGVFPDQVPFFRIHLGPLAASAASSNR